MNRIFGSGLGTSREVFALIVDDSFPVRTIIQMMLNMCGIKTVVVENGQEAVDLFRAGQNFDFIIMDLRMPVKNGIQATMELRAMGVKSLIIGNLVGDSKQDVEPFMNAGLDGYFEKPIGFDGIASILEWLEQ